MDFALISWLCQWNEGYLRRTGKRRRSMDDLAHEAIDKIPRFYKKKVKLSTSRRGEPGQRFCGRGGWVDGMWV